MSRLLEEYIYAIFFTLMSQIQVRSQCWDPISIIWFWDGTTSSIKGTSLRHIYLSRLWRYPSLVRNSHSTIFSAIFLQAAI